MLGYPLTPPLGTPVADRPTHLPPSPPSRPPKVFAPSWGLEFEQGAPFVLGLRLAGVWVEGKGVGRSRPRDTWAGSARHW